MAHLKMSNWAKNTQPLSVYLRHGIMMAQLNIWPMLNPTILVAGDPVMAMMLSAKNRWLNSLYSWRCSLALLQNNCYSYFEVVSVSVAWNWKAK